MDAGEATGQDRMGRDVTDLPGNLRAGTADPAQGRPAASPDHALREGRPCSPAGVAVLTLTYGDRSGMLGRMIAGVAAEGVRHVLVLANGLAPGPAERLARLARLARESGGVTVHIHDSPVNLGSSQGYARLVAAASALPDVGAVWFLDDDNLPRPGSLALLLEAQGRMGGSVAAVRTDRAYLMEAARTGRSEPPHPGAAFGVDLRGPFRRAWRKLRRPAPGPVPAAVPVAMAPYGGLLVPRVEMDRIAPPRDDFIIYADDYDYSERLAASAGLHLVGGALIDDLEASWNATPGAGTAGPAPRRQGQLARLAAMKPDFRLYYSLRNALWLDRQRLGPATWPVFVVNLAWLVVAAGGRAALQGRWENARTIATAAFHAVTGRLGRHPAFPLP